MPRFNFNHTFTKTTKSDAKREVNVRYQDSKRDREAGDFPEDQGFSEAIRDAACSAIDAMPDETTNFNVEISGPSPLKILVEQGPR